MTQQNIFTARERGTLIVSLLCACETVHALISVSLLLASSKNHFLWTTTMDLVRPMRVYTEHTSQYRVNASAFFPCPRTACPFEKCMCCIYAQQGRVEDKRVTLDEIVAQQDQDSTFLLILPKKFEYIIANTIPCVVKIMRGGYKVAIFL